MKKQMILSVPNPCQEGWHTMTPTEKGRFCSSCSKEVVDFSVMTDQQLFSYLTKSSTHVCGHFAAGQLDRTIAEPTKPIKKTFWAVLFSFVLPFIAFNKAQAQKKPKPPIEQKIKGRGEKVGMVIKNNDAIKDTVKTKTPKLLPPTKDTIDQSVDGFVEIVRSKRKDKR